jgi:hypothetical protein
MQRFDQDCPFRHESHDEDLLASRSDGMGVGMMRAGSQRLAALDRTISARSGGRLSNNSPKTLLTSSARNWSSRMEKIIAMIAASLAAHASVSAAESAADKTRFNLFNPTPSALLRELATDRPDKTECPFTVDAGHIQVESDLAVYSRDRDRDRGEDSQTDAWSLAAVNIKFGLTNSSDFQVVLEPFLRVKSVDRSTQPATVERNRGFGDVTLRYKVNFWGNDGGSSALGLMPFVKLPTSQHGLGNRAVEAGVILPYNRSLAGGWELGTQLELDVMSNEKRGGHHAEYVSSITFGHDLAGALGGYVEVFSQHSAQRGSRWVGTLDLGLTYGVSRDIQLDAGVNLGLSDAAADVEFFSGISVRF